MKIYVNQFRSKKDFERLTCHSNMTNVERSEHVTNGEVLKRIGTRRKLLNFVVQNEERKIGKFNTHRAHQR